MQFFPHFPLHVNVVALFGLTLLLGLLGGELAKRAYFFPKISGYIAVGFLFGPSILNIITPSLFSGSRTFINISLGLILFDLGRHLDFKWLRHDYGIILMSLSESCLTFVFVWVVLVLLHISWLHAALAATIAVTTSPAIVMMVADDLSAKGPVTRRSLILISLNNLFGLILFTTLLPFTQSDNFLQIADHIAYRLIGSIFVGMLIFLLTLGIAYFIGKQKENQFVLFIGSVMFGIGLAKILNLSSMLTLFTFGVAARNFNFGSLLTELNFEWLAKLFFILLFVFTGMYLQLRGLWQTAEIVFSFLLARTIGKSCGVWLFAKSSRLTSQQTWAICLTLIPMSGLAVGMSNIILDFNPSLGYQLITVLTTSIAVLNIIGPITTQFAFVKSGETLYSKNI